MVRSEAMSPSGIGTPKRACNPITISIASLESSASPAEQECIGIDIVWCVVKLEMIDQVFLDLQRNIPALRDFCSEDDTRGLVLIINVFYSRFVDRLFGNAEAVP